MLRALSMVLLCDGSSNRRVASPEVYPMNIATRFLLVLSCVSSWGCEKVFGTRPGKPGAVTDLAVTSVSLSSVSISWTQVPDGTKNPAHYAVAFSTSADSIDLSRGIAGLRIVEGNKVGEKAEYMFDELRRGETYFVQVVAIRPVLDSLPEMGIPSNRVSATTEVDPPDAVEDLAASPSGLSSAVIRWTEVDDGRGLPAAYVLASGTPPLSWESSLTSRTYLQGTSIGSIRSLVVSSLSPGSQREFQLATVRGTASDTSAALFLSNIAAITLPNEPAGGSVTPFFQDNFDTGTRTSANGFLWSSSSGRVVVSSAHSLSGTHSLAFRFGPDTLKQDSSAEQRFRLGRNLSEFWLEYFIRIPENFTVRADGGPANNKFFAVWAEAYSTAGDLQLITEFERNTVTASRARMLSMSENFPASSIRKDGFQNNNFLTEALRGQWKRVRVHVKASSGSQQLDGIYEGWLDDELMWRSSNWSIWYPGGKNYFSQGYFMGWANSGYTEETLFFIDNVKFYSADPNWWP